MIALWSLSFLTPAGWCLVVCVLLAVLVVLACYTVSLYRRHARYDSLLVGQIATVLAWHERDRRVELFGAIWQARVPDGVSTSLQADDRVRVTHIHDLVLTVIPVGDA